MSQLRFLALGALLLLGCDSRSSSPIRAVYQNGDMLRGLVCDDCFERLGFATAEECHTSMIGSYTEDELQCLERVYADNAAASRSAVQCQSEASAELLDCMRRRTDCGGSFDACLDAYGTAAMACPSLPEAVSLQFQACFSTGDRDGDGIADSLDECPDDREDFDGDADSDGCPDGAADNTYGYCEDTDDCVSADVACVALTVPAASTSGTYCTRECASDAECEPNHGYNGACYDVGGSGTFLCFQSCAFDSDCYATSVCVEIDPGGGVIDFICLPAA